MGLSFDDLLKFKEVLKDDILTEIKEVIQSIRENMASKHQLQKALDILAKHEKYIETEQKFVVKHIDQNEKRLDKLEEKISLL